MKWFGREISWHSEKKRERIGWNPAWRSLLHSHPRGGRHNLSVNVDDRNVFELPLQYDLPCAPSKVPAQACLRRDDRGMKFYDRRLPGPAPGMLGRYTIDGGWFSEVSRLLGA